MSKRAQQKRFSIADLVAEGEEPVDIAWDQMRPVGIEFGAELNDENEYLWALREVEKYFDADPEPDPKSPEGARFQILIDQIERNENKLT